MTFGEIREEVRVLFGGVVGPFLVVFEAELEGVVCKGVLAFHLWTKHVKAYCVEWMMNESFLRLSSLIVCARLYSSFQEHVAAVVVAQALA